MCTDEDARLPTTGYTEAVHTMFKRLHAINIIGRQLRPTDEDIDKFQHLCNEYHRLLCMNFTDDDYGAFYVHVLCKHGPEYIRHLRSLGKYMNSNVEHHHKIMNRYCTVNLTSTCCV